MWAPLHGSTPPVESRKEGAEGPFPFLFVTLPLACYIQRTYLDVAPYPLRTTLLPFADDMEVVTANAPQPLFTTPDTTRATKVLHAVTNYLEGNKVLVHNVKSATMVHNAPPPPLRPAPMILAAVFSQNSTSQQKGVFRGK